MTRPRIDPAAGGIVRSLRAAAGPLVLEQADSTPWSSLTFAGARHTLALRCADPDTAFGLAAGLTSREFVISGHIVADIGAVAVEGAVLRFEALTVEDG